MLKGLIPHKAKVGLCGTCMDTRGLGSAKFVDGTERSSMDELAEWVIWADRVLTF